MGCTQIIFVYLIRMPFSHRYLGCICDDHQSSPVATGGFGGLSPPNKALRPPKLKHETL